MGYLLGYILQIEVSNGFAVFQEFCSQLVKPMSATFSMDTADGIWTEFETGNYSILRETYVRGK